jgi:hypothetical protein
MENTQKQEECKDEALITSIRNTKGLSLMKQARIAYE